MLITKRRRAGVKGDLELFSDIALKPIAKKDKFTAREIIHTHMRCIFARNAFVVFSDFTIINLQAVKSIAGLLICVSPHTWFRFNRLIEIWCSV